MNLELVNWEEIIRNKYAIDFIQKYGLNKYRGGYFREKSSFEDTLKKDIESFEKMENNNKNEWETLDMTEDDIALCEENLDFLDWSALSAKSKAVPFLTNHIDRIVWSALSANPEAYDLLENNLKKINIRMLSKNTTSRIYTF